MISVVGSTEMQIRFEEVGYSFSNRITNMWTLWNSLPDSVVMADTVLLTDLKIDLISTGLNMHFV